MTFDRGDDGFECRQFFVRLARKRVVVVAQAVAAMEPVRALVRTIQRFFRAHEHGNIGAAQLRGVERIAGGLLNSNVSRNRGNGDHAHRGGTQCHDQGHGVIGSSVGIDQEERFHAA